MKTKFIENKEHINLKCDEFLYYVLIYNILTISHSYSKQHSGIFIHHPILQII